LFIINLLTTKLLKGILIFLGWDGRRHHGGAFGGQNDGRKLKK
jgi:hypothetical protein